MAGTDLEKQLKFEWIIIAIGSIGGAIYGLINPEVGPSFSYHTPWYARLWMGIGIGGNLGFAISILRLAGLDMAKDTIKKDGFIAGIRDSFLGALFLAIILLLIGIFTGPIIPIYRILKNIWLIQTFKG